MSTIYNTNITYKKIKDKNRLEYTTIIQLPNKNYKVTFAILNIDNNDDTDYLIFKYNDRVYRIYDYKYTKVDEGVFSLRFNTITESIIINVY